jgi:hypothetical protein
MTKKNMDSAKAKLDIITSMAGSDPEMALSILSYALIHVAHENNVMFASLIQNLSILEIMFHTEAGHAE